MSFTFYHLGAHQVMVYLLPQTALTYSKLAKWARFIYTTGPSSGLTDFFLSMKSQRSSNDRPSNMEERHQNEQRHNREQDSCKEQEGTSPNSDVCPQGDLRKYSNKHRTQWKWNKHILRNSLLDSKYVFVRRENNSIAKLEN